MTLAPGLTGGTLDRADRIRHDAEALAAATADWRARLLLLDALDPPLDQGGRLAWTTLADAPDDAELLFLGFERDRPHFTAVRPGDRPVRDRSLRAFHAVSALTREEAALYAAARSLVDWHVRHRFCAACGNPSTIFRAGWGRQCGACGAEHFPRVDPVVIMLPVFGDKALLGRQPGWPAGRFSALAGFVEVGESIEEAVARETLEEAGLTVSNVRYLASQPWPFPSSLMIACIAQVDGDTITLDTNELEAAMWVEKPDVRAALAGDPTAPFLAPPPVAIAHTLLTAWVDEADRAVLTE